MMQQSHVYFVEWVFFFFFSQSIFAGLYFQQAHFWEMVELMAYKGVILLFKFLNLFYEDNLSLPVYVLMLYTLD